MPGAERDPASRKETGQKETARKAPLADGPAQLPPVPIPDHRVAALRIKEGRLVLDLQGGLGARIDTQFAKQLKGFTESVSVNAGPGKLIALEVQRADGTKKRELAQTITVKRSRALDAVCVCGAKDREGKEVALSAMRACNKQALTSANVICIDLEDARPILNHEQGFGRLIAAKIKAERWAPNANYAFKAEPGKGWDVRIGGRRVQAAMIRVECDLFTDSLLVTELRDTKGAMLALTGVKVTSAGSQITEVHAADPAPRRDPRAKPGKLSAEERAIAEGKLKTSNPAEAAQALLDAKRR